jgi:hypothetical protein
VWLPLRLHVYENAAECPALSIRPGRGWIGVSAAVLKFDNQDILVLHGIFAEAGKPRLPVKPPLVGGELHCDFLPFFRNIDLMAR